MKNRVSAHIALVLGILELGLILASWIFSSMFPDSGMRSLLGSEGVRWFFGRFTDIVSGRLLVWLILLSVAFGCARESGISHIFRGRLQYRERIALSFAVCMFLIYSAVFITLAFIPHAILLSASGELFPSPFSASLIPVVSFGICLLSVVYGIVSGRFRSVEDVYMSLFAGISTAAPVFLYYILLIQLYYSVLFVFG